jgi:hypothetical protein
VRPAGRHEDRIARALVNEAHAMLLHEFLLLLAEADGGATLLALEEAHERGLVLRRRQEPQLLAAHQVEVRVRAEEVHVRRRVRAS